MKLVPAALLLLALASSPLFAQDAAPAAPPDSAPAKSAHAATAKPLTVNIINSDSQTIGTATLSQAAHGVRIVVDIKKLPAGPHLMHIHEFPKCDAPDFKSAGAHFNPHNADNGGAMGPMAGDIPHFELTVAENGTAHVSVIAPGVTMGTAANSIFANGGTSIVIHQVAQTVSDSAPPRIACAIVTRPQ